MSAKLILSIATETRRKAAICRSCSNVINPGDIRINVSYDVVIQYETRSGSPSFYTHFACMIRNPIDYTDKKSFANDSIQPVEVFPCFDFETQVQFDIPESFDTYSAVQQHMIRWCEQNYKSRSQIDLSVNLNQLQRESLKRKDVAPKSAINTSANTSSDDATDANKRQCTDVWMSTGRAAKELGITISQLRTWCKQNLVQNMVNPNSGHRTINITDAKIYIANAKTAKQSDDRVLCYSFAEHKNEATQKMEILQLAYPSSERVLLYAYDQSQIKYAADFSKSRVHECRMKAVRLVLEEYVITRKIDKWILMSKDDVCSSDSEFEYLEMLCSLHHVQISVDLQIPIEFH